MSRWRFKEKRTEITPLNFLAKPLMATYRTPPSVRVTFDLSEVSFQRFNSLCRLHDGNSRANTLRDALRIYSYLLEQQKEGKSVELVSPVAIFGFKLFNKVERIF